MKGSINSIRRCKSGKGKFDRGWYKGATVCSSIGGGRGGKEEGSSRERSRWSEYGSEGKEES